MPALAADTWGPWEAPQTGTGVVKTKAEDTELDPLKLGIRFHQKYISPVDGPRCSAYPTCSAYAMDALNKHGPFIGTMMTVDRLFYDSSLGGQSRLIRVGGRMRFYDPVENNDFWFVDQ